MTTRRMYSGSDFNVPVEVQSDGSEAPISRRLGAQQTVRTSLTRPADTVGYAAGDAVGGLLTFAAAGRDANRTTTLDQVLITTNAPLWVPTFQLWLFNSATFASLATDNNAFNFLTGDENGVFQGVVELPPMQAMGASGTAVYAFEKFNHPVLTNASGNLYGQLVTKSVISASINGQVINVTTRYWEK